MCSEISQSQNDKYHLCEIPRETESRMLVVRGWG